MDIRAIITRRAQAILMDWRQDPLLQVLVESPAVLSDVLYLLDDGTPGAADRLGRRSVGNVAIWRRHGDPDSRTSLWVRASYSDYRSAYLGFVREVYQIAATAEDLAGFQIDHLLNRARAPLGSTFIRVEAIPAAVNQRWGSLFERIAADNHRGRRTMSWLIASKLAGQMPPAGPNDDAGIKRLALFWATRGFAAREAEDGIRQMLNFSYGVR
jgi:hypothetical protein